MSARLSELAAQYGLPDDAVPRLEALLALVAEDETAPTTVRDPERAVDAHVADSLTGLEIDVLRRAGRIADLGAGAGFPGLVLAAALPDARVALVESLGRKCAFLERAVERMRLANADVVCARAEEWSEGVGTIDVVTVRAVAPLNVLAEYAAPLLVLGGHLVASASSSSRSDRSTPSRAPITVTSTSTRRFGRRHLDSLVVREWPASGHSRPGLEGGRGWFGAEMRLRSDRPHR